MIEHTPPCKYFNKCGGCSLQHLINHGEHKIQALKVELEKLNFTGVLHPLKQVPHRSRRRANFKIYDYCLSFNKLKSKELVTISECLLLEDAINELIKPLNKLLRKLKIKIDSISFTNSDTGIELVFHSKEKSDLNCDQLLADFAQQHNISRVVWNSSIVMQHKPLQLQFTQGWVDLPINSFLQVSKESNNLMIETILSNLENDKRILELYCGCGSFTIPMSIKANITAIEGSEEPVNALAAASRRHNLKINPMKQDLYLKPLLPEELNNYAQIVINPPRNGATPQFRNIANSRKVNKVIMVSCSIKNFIRDSKYLQDGGFTLKDIYPIDQFLYSNHLEVIAIYSR